MFLECNTAGQPLYINLDHVVTIGVDGIVLKDGSRITLQGPALQDAIRDMFERNCLSVKLKAKGS